MAIVWGLPKRDPNFRNPQKAPVIRALCTDLQKTSPEPYSSCTQFSDLLYHVSASATSISGHCSRTMFNVCFGLGSWQNPDDPRSFIHRALSTVGIQDANFSRSRSPMQIHKPDIRLSMLCTFFVSCFMLGFRRVPPSEICSCCPGSVQSRQGLFCSFLRVEIQNGITI